MKIVLADDHALFRAGLRNTLIEAFGDAAEVVEASDFAGLKAAMAESDHLDIVLCDLRMPDIDPLSAVEDLVRLRPETPVVVISASEDAEDACRSIRQGAKGYVPKSDSLLVLQRALELILAGGVYVPALALDSMEETPESALAKPAEPAEEGQPAAQTGPAPTSLPMLSNRQMMIFERLAVGKPNKTIARELGIAEGTVKAQLRTVFRKLGVSNRTQAALFAAKVLGRETGGDAVEAVQAAELGGKRASPLRQTQRGKLKVLNFPN